jgi:F-type H+-transporting ATPase subunit epsilon
MSIELEIISPEKILFSQKADMVIAPGNDGEFGVLAGHIPFITSLKAGVVGVYSNNQLEQEIEIKGGFFEIKNNRCVILVAGDNIVVGKEADAPTE